MIANQGFIQRVGYDTGNGEYVISGSHLALFGAMQSFGQLIGMISMNPISDTIGRKTTLYALWVLGVVVSCLPASRSGVPC